MIHPDDRLLDLLDRCIEARGPEDQSILDDLSREHPELKQQFFASIETLRAMEWLNHPDADVLDSARTAPEDFGLPDHFGRYRLERLAGMGGFGQVWQAFDPELVRQVAVKISHVPGNMTEARSDRFLAEARRTASLRHRGIVPVHDVGYEHGYWYIVTDLIGGTTLAERLHKEPIPAQLACQMTAEVALTLHHAHVNGIIHRDVKPSNVMVSPSNEVFLIDFGIAALASELSDSRTNRAGTRRYMSPEQCRGLDLDPRSDVFSLGAVLFELLTGERLIDSLDPQEAERLILAGVTPERLQRVPARLRTICARALQVDRESRYATADEFAADLLRAIDRDSASTKKRWSSLVALTASIALLVAGWEWNTRQTAHTLESKGRDYVNDGDPLNAVPFLLASNNIRSFLGRKSKTSMHDELRKCLASSPRLVGLRPISVNDSTIYFSGVPENILLGSAKTAPTQWNFATDEIYELPDHCRAFGRLIRNGKPVVPVIDEIDWSISLFDLEGRLATARCALPAPPGRSIVVAGAHRGNLLAATAELGEGYERHFYLCDFIRQKAYGPFPEDLTRGFRQINRITFSDDFDTMLLDASLGPSLQADNLKALEKAGMAGPIDQPVGVLLRTSGTFTPLQGEELIRLSPNGRFVAIQNASAYLVLQTTSDPPRSRKVDGQYFNAIAFSPDSARLATGTDDGTLRVIHVGVGENSVFDEGDLIETYKVPGHIAQIVYADDSRFLAAAYDEAVSRSVVQVFDADLIPLTPKLPHGGPISAIDFDPTGRFLLTASQDGLLRVWELNRLTQEEIERLDGKTLARSSEVLSGLRINKGEMTVLSSAERYQLWQQGRRSVGLFRRSDSAETEQPEDRESSVP